MTPHYIKYLSLDQKLTLNTADATALAPLDFVGKSTRQTDSTYYTTDFVDSSGTGVAESKSLDLQECLANFILQLTLFPVSLRPPITRSTSFPLEPIARILAFFAQSWIAFICIITASLGLTLDFPLLRIYLL
jgi:hypothetical protein